MVARFRGKAEDVIRKCRNPSFSLTVHVRPGLSSRAAHKGFHHTQVPIPICPPAFPQAFNFCTEPTLLRSSRFRHHMLQASRAMRLATVPPQVHTSGSAHGAPHTSISFIHPAVRKVVSLPKVLGGQSPNTPWEPDMFDKRCIRTDGMFCRCRMWGG